MDMTTILGSIVASWIASVLVFPIIPIQHWLNSIIRTIGCWLTLRNSGLSGRWHGIYKLENNAGEEEIRIEIINCFQLSGNEIRGSIKDKNTGDKYKFLGKIVYDEIVAHYWHTDDSKDIGCYKFKSEPGKRILKGNLIVFDSKSGTDKPGIEYEWRRFPRISNNFYTAISTIEGAGMFSNRFYEKNKPLGKLKYGKKTTQGKYTVLIKGEHRIAKKPWRFINHSCEPNSSIENNSNGIFLTAKKDIHPQDEITIDYSTLNENIDNKFSCVCSKCKESDSPKRIE